MHHLLSYDPRVDVVVVSAMPRWNVDDVDVDAEAMGVGTTTLRLQLLLVVVSPPAYPTATERRIDKFYEALLEWAVLVLWVGGVDVGAW